MRSSFVAALLILFYTVRQATIGFQDVQFAGDVASFSSLVFQVFSTLQLTLGMFFATLFTASSVAQEKDRQTLILLLMTDMKNHELALGKLGASLLVAAVLLAASLPVSCSLRLLGGVTWPQVFWASAVIGSASLAAGAWGGMVAFRKEKTFQTLAISVLGVVVFIAAAESLVTLAGSDSSIAFWIAALSPYRSLSEVLFPLQKTITGPIQVSALPSVLAFLSLAVLLTAITVVRMRVWNPSQTMRVSALQMAVPEEQDEKTPARPAPASAAVHHRTVWTNPVIWREMRTRPYGKRVFWIKLVYVLLALGVVWSAGSTPFSGDTLVLGMVSPAAFAFLGVGIMSLLLINAQAVTSITTERDGRTLEPLLITDLSAREFMLGKIGGAIWNAGEMIFLPLILLVGLTMARVVPSLTPENCFYLIMAFLVLALFAISLGLHAGLSYENSRTAIGNSLGTMFFLFIGIFVFMLLLVEARSSFAMQIQSFIIFIGFGSLGLFSSLTHKNPSSALTMASMSLPFLTFYAITDFLLGGNLGVCFWICVAYGFTSVAMLIPAMTDFDVALGRNTQDQG